MGRGAPFSGHRRTCLKPPRRVRYSTPLGYTGADAKGGSVTAIDPVCGMEVDTSNPPGGTAEHDGTTYYFCDESCRLDFVQDPSNFLQEL